MAFPARKIVTSHVYPPIPVRNFDWCAYFDDEGASQPEGSMLLHRIKGRMVNCYRVARSLEDKGFVTRTKAGRDSADYLHITAAGRDAIAGQEQR